ncbi:HNH endonuclease signature motif containing protein [Nocardia acidivorans]|uniref:HNH endonuclease signature motif containing protein n=1 Tax=Nocardia acidivorans TaxID=404580 RepID=UPI0008299381|nr:HNH endonuclease signature motif containing protein [Nocardia acidivorans]
MGESAVAELTSYELVERLRAVHSRIAVGQAEEAELMTRLYRLRRAQQLELGVRAVHAGEDAATEIAVVLKVSQRQADVLIGFGLDLDARLPHVREAFAAGRIDLPRARAIRDVLLNASDELVALVEPRIAAYAETADPSRVKRTLRRWLLELDPAGQTERRKAAEADRYVTVSAADNGTAILDGVLPARGAQALYERLREMASTQCCGNDPRTTNQRRADALIALADGSNRLSCQCSDENCPRAAAPDQSANPRKALVQVGVSAETLAGLCDNPALLAGFGAIDPDLARQIARHAHFDIITDTTPEAPVTDSQPAAESGVTASAAAKSEMRYRPAVRLAGKVRALDGGCRAPGCMVPAAATDLDHQDRFNRHSPETGGHTTESNLGCRCRRHHRLKTLADNGLNGWQVVHHPHRRVEWRSPTGESITTTPEGMKFLFPRAQIPPITANGVPTPTPIDPLLNPGRVINALTELVHVYCTPTQRRRKPVHPQQKLPEYSDAPPF